MNISTDRASDLTDDELADNLRDCGFDVKQTKEAVTVTASGDVWRRFLDELADTKDVESLRNLARRLYGRAIEGDEFSDNDIAELRAFGLIDDDGFPTYDDEDGESK